LSPLPLMTSQASSLSLSESARDEEVKKEVGFWGLGF